MPSSRRALVPGEIRGRGREGVYRRLEARGEEGRVVRTELARCHDGGAERRSLLHLAHLTDTHIVDASSPGRFEFAERLYDLEELRHMLPTYRPQEMLSVHAFDAMIRTVNDVDAGPVTGVSLDAVLITGDLIDNAQRNELLRFLDVVVGRTVHPAGHGPYEGVAHPSWGDAAYWHPDEVSDEYRLRWGFPSYPGLLEELARPFRAAGLRHPWLACPGNHDMLAHGTALIGEAYDAVLRGTQKAAAFPPDLVLSASPDQFELFLRAPETFLGGEARPISPDPERCALSPEELLTALRGVPGNMLGNGHGGSGFPAPGWYHAHDVSDSVRLITLDTANSAGHWEGSIGARQHAWLEQRLIEVHSQYWDQTGRRRQTENRDRLVVIAAHHPLHTLTNLRGHDGRSPDDFVDEPRLDERQVVELLHRFPNVILVLNGHIHRNQIRPHPDRAGRTPGFWEVTTSSLVDWPCEGRLIELAENGDGSLSILTTMIASAAPADPEGAEGVLRLASIHRELAANDPHAGWQSGRAGGPSDRITDLRLPAPSFLADAKPAMRASQRR